MANSKKDVTLVIRAQNEAKAEFEKLVALINKIEKGFDGSQDSAAELSAELNRLAASAGGQFFGKVEKDVSRLNREYKETQLRIKEIAAARRALVAQTGPFQPAKQKEYNSQLKASETEMSRLQKKAGSLSAEYRQQLTLLRQMRATAGSITPQSFGSRLASAQASISGTSARPGAGGLGDLFKYDPTGPRQTLDFYQRLRGQILAMTGAYIGLYGAANQFSKALEEQVKTQGVRSRLSAILGTTDSGAINAEIDKLKAKAEELGQQFLPLADSFSKFSAAARLSGQSVAAVNTVFDNITKAGTTLNLTGDELGGVFLGLQQIFSKGKVTAEDFRGQVAERLPGAIPILARSMGVAQEALDKMFEQGLIGSEEMISFAVEYQKNVEAGLIPATTNLRANLARLTNDTVELRATFMEGAEEGLLAAIENLRETLKDPQFQRDVKEFGKAVGSLVEALSEIAPHVPDIIKLVSVFVGFRALSGGLRVLRDLRGEFGLLKDTLPKLLGASNQTAAAFKANGGLLTIFSSMEGVAWRLTRAVGPIGLAGAVLALAYNMREVSKETQGASSVLANFIEGARRTLGVSDGTPFGNYSSGAATQPKTPGESVSRREAFEKNRAAYLAEQNKKTDEQIALEEARANKVQSTTDALHRQVVELQKKADTETKINEQARKDREALAATYEAAKKAIQATYDPKGGDAERQRVKTELAVLRDEYVSGRRAIAERAAQEVAKIHEKELRDRLAREKEHQDLVRSVEKYSIDPEDRLTIEHAALLDEARRMNEQIDALDQIDQKEKEILKTLVKQGFERRVQKMGLDETIRLAAEQEEAANKLIQIRDTRIQTISAQGEASGVPQTEIQKQIQAEYANTESAIRSALESALQFYNTLGDEQKVEQIKLQLAELDKGLDAVDVRTTQLKDRFASGLADGLIAVADGSKTASDALRDFAKEFLSFIAQAIIKKQILNAIEGGTGGGFFSAIGGLLHGGGLAGSANLSRSGLNPAAFMFAPRYHSGGIAGVKPDEVPAILQRGEEVLTKNDPRHIMNGAGKGAAQVQPELNVKLVNSIDSDDVMNQAMSSPGTDKAFINKIKANRNALIQVLK